MLCDASSITRAAIQFAAAAVDKAWAAPSSLCMSAGGAVTEAELHALILSFPEAEQSSHMGTTDFRVRGKIFATRPEAGRLVLKLSGEQQQMLCEAEGAVFAGLPNKWGDKGWTSASIAALDMATASSVLRMAWANVAPKRLTRER
jgi:hypothetical protein